MSTPIIVSAALSADFIKSNNIGFILSLVPNILDYTSQCPDIPYSVVEDVSTATLQINLTYMFSHSCTVIFSLDLEDPLIQKIITTYNIEYET